MRAPARLHGGRSRPRPLRARAPSARCGSSWSRRAASSARSVGRNGDLAVRLACHRHHLGEEERVAAGGARDPCAQVVVEAVRQELVGLVRCERVEPDRSGPGGAALDQLRPSHAKKKKRRIAGEQGGRLDEVEEALLSPTGCRRTAPPAAPVPRAACGRPRRSPRRSPPSSLSPSSERIDAAAAGSEGRASSCFSTSTTGQ